MSKDATMTGDATITFSLGGVQPPVYVVTSLSGWTVLEMDVQKDRTETGDLVFAKHFNNIAKGRYQYKVRIGDNHWVVDESKESDMDEHGNRNNVIYVKPNCQPEPASSETSITKDSVTKAQEDDSDSAKADGKDSSIEADDLPVVPIPLVTVEKIEDEEPPSYGGPEPVSLSSDTKKSAADPESDHEEVREDSATSSPDSTELPLLVVQKTSDDPAYGDDFGQNATTVQKIAHEMRAADASPDELVVVTDQSSSKPALEEQEVPLFSHEDIQTHGLSSSASLDTLEEESTQSSTDQTSSGDALNTPSEDADFDEEDELNQGPLLSHETGFSNLNGSLTSHTTDVDEEQDVDEFDQTPLLPHETGFTDDEGVASDAYDYEDEYDRTPLFSYETGFSDDKRSENMTQADSSHGNEGSECRSSRLDDNEDQDYVDDNDDVAPLLPHEQFSPEPSKIGSDDAHFSFDNQPTFDYESDGSQGWFMNKKRANFFRTRGSWSNLPHKMPRSDAEDDDLNDPSLERFPTDREQIFERVATIGHNLPEDDPIDDHHSSPPLSVLSQACSSVDLVPVKSYTSLASVPEADFSDEEEDNDVDSLPSPVFIGGDRSSRSHFGFARDPNVTPIPNDSKQLGFIEEEERELREKDETANDVNQTAASIPAANADESDGARDTPATSSDTDGPVSVPAKVLPQVILSHVSEHVVDATKITSISDLSSELRERRKPADDTVGASAQECGPEGKANDSTSLALVQPNSNFLNACLADRKRASASVMVLGMAAAACYYFASGP